MKKKKITPGKKDGRPKTTVKQRVEKIGLDYGRIQKMMQFGLTDKDLAFVLGITEATITNWKKDDPDFFTVPKEGKDILSYKEKFSGK